jgi:hypothetical protein
MAIGKIILATTVASLATGCVSTATKTSTQSESTGVESATFKDSAGKNSRK